MCLAGLPIKTYGKTGNHILHMLTTPTAGLSRALANSGRLADHADCATRFADGAADFANGVASRHMHVVLKHMHIADSAANGCCPVMQLNVCSYSHSLL